MINLSKKSPVEVMHEKVFKIHSDIEQTMFEYFESAIKENISSVFYLDRGHSTHVFSLRGNGKTSVLAKLSRQYGLPLIVQTDFLKKYTVERFDVSRNLIYSIQDVLDDKLRGRKPNLYLLDEVPYEFFVSTTSQVHRMSSLFGYVGFVFRG